MAGRHAAARLRGRASPLVAALLVAVVIVGSAIVAFTLRGSVPQTDAPVAVGQSTGAPTTPPAPSLAEDRAALADRAARSGIGRAPQTPSPSPSTSKAAPKPKPKPKPEPEPTEEEKPDTGGTVTDSGRCETSFYWQGQVTANGESFDPEGLTAAHKTLKFNTRVRVTNERNGKSVTVRINDRGPFIEGRCLDLARGAFRQIASLDAGVIMAKYEVLG